MSKKVDEILESIQQLSLEEWNELIRRLLTSEEDRNYYTFLDQMLSEDWDNEKDEIYNTNTFESKRKLSELTEKELRQSIDFIRRSRKYFDQE